MCHLTESQNAYLNSIDRDPRSRRAFLNDVSTCLAEHDRRSGLDLGRSMVPIAIITVLGAHGVA